VSLSHNYARKSPLVTMGRPKFSPKTAAFPFRWLSPHLIHPSLHRPHSPSQTASGSNQPFCHSTLSDTHTDRHTDRQCLVKFIRMRHWGKVSYLRLTCFIIRMLFYQVYRQYFILYVLVFAPNHCLYCNILSSVLCSDYSRDFIKHFMSFYQYCIVLLSIVFTYLCIV